MSVFRSSGKHADYPHIATIIIDLSLVSA